MWKAGKIAALTFVVLPVLAERAQLATGPVSGPAQEGCTLIVNVTGARNTKGGVGGLLFKNTDGWPENRDKAFVRGTFPISGTRSTLTFDHIPAGQYGLVILHDENMNHKLDRNFLTIPKEGFAFGNNPHVGLTAPKMKDAMVNVSCPVTQVELHLLYK